MRTASPTTLLAALAATAVAAADGPTYDLSREDVWKVGDVVSVAVAERDGQKVSTTLEAGKAPLVLSRQSTVTANLVVRCLEADAAGRAARVLVYVKDWTFEAGKQKDTSLSGARVEVRGRGKDRVHALVATGNAGAPSAAATAWLERRYSARRPDADDLRRPWRPKAPVALGATWDADVAALVEGRFADFPVDRAGVKATARLADVAGKTAKVACAASIPLLGLPTKRERDAPPVPWTRGGIASLSGEIVLPLEGRLAGSSVSWRATLSGEATREGKPVAFDMTIETRATVSIGGEIPEAVEPPPSRAGTEPLPAPKESEPAAPR